MTVKLMGMLLMMLAGWINRHQQDVIVYLREENKILRERLGTKRILLSKDPPSVIESPRTITMRGDEPF